jgi:hypothetical protein
MRGAAVAAAHSCGGSGGLPGCRVGGRDPKHVLLLCCVCCLVRFCRVIKPAPPTVSGRPRPRARAGIPAAKGAQSVSSGKPGESVGLLFSCGPLLHTPPHMHAAKVHLLGRGGGGGGLQAGPGVCIFCMGPHGAARRTHGAARRTCMHPSFGGGPCPVHAPARRAQANVPGGAGVGQGNFSTSFRCVVLRVGAGLGVCCRPGWGPWRCTTAPPLPKSFSSGLRGVLHHPPGAPPSWPAR